MEFKKLANNTINFGINRIIEILGLGIIIAGVLLLISLTSFSPNDPNFIFPDNTTIKNLLGFRGSIPSNLFLPLASTRSNFLDVIFESISSLLFTRFLFSTRFLFQNLDRVILFDNQFNLVGDTDTLDLDPRSFSNRLDIVQLEILNEEISNKIIATKNINKEKTVSLKDILTNYSWSKDYGKPFFLYLYF